jgi:probable F420-dependent oxidoreductase
VTHPRRFRFAVDLQHAFPDRSWPDSAREAESLGYSTMFVPDHFDEGIGPLTAMATAAAATTTLNVGALVLDCDFRHPAVLARELASIDLLSEGRLEIGLGAGWKRLDYDRSGIPMDPPKVRVDRLIEHTEVLKGLFAGGPFSFKGEHYTITELDGQPKPVQRPHPPFVIGGGGPKVLALAAREAQIVGVNANLRSGDGNSSDAASSLTSARTDEKIGWLRDAAGAHFDDLEIQTLVGFVHVTDDPGPIFSGMASHFDVTPEEVRQAPVTLVGSIDEMVDMLEERRERWQMSYVVIDAAFAETFEPVVARLAGK